MALNKKRTDGYGVNRRGELVKQPDYPDGDYEEVMPEVARLVREYGYYVVLNAVCNLACSDSQGKWPPADGIPQSMLDLAEKLYEPLDELLDRVYPEDAFTV